IGLGGLFVGCWRPVEADQAFQALEGKLDAPAQAIEIGYILVRKRIFRQGRDDDQPIGCDKGGVRDLMAAALCGSSCVASGCFGGLVWLEQRHEPELER